MLAKWRIYCLVLVDAVLINVALYGALWLRFDGTVPYYFWRSCLHLAGFYTAATLLIFYFMGLYRRLWQYAGTGELLNVLYAVTLGTVANVALAYFLQERLPRSVFIISWGLTIGFIGGSRLFWRLFREQIRGNGGVRGLTGLGLPKVGRRVLIAGAGDAGAMVARELKHRNGNGTGHNYNPVGFIDDDRGKQGQQILGLPILGARGDLFYLADRHAIEEVIIAMPSAPGRVVREIVNTCRELDVAVKTLPGISELIDGRVTVNSIREVHVEDLLRRDPVAVDLQEIATYLRGRTVLVTGAGGSIGSELCRQVVRFEPACLVLLGHDENPIFEIEHELGHKHPALRLETTIADIKDRAKINSVFNWYRPQIVFHAAAHKHVPLMEANPEEAVSNNIIGTRNVAEAADRVGSFAFVLISTDKTVNPTSVMGASKRVAEMFIQTLAGRSRTRFAAVRFGNVLGSRGSVLPTFKEQIAHGGPVEVTHPEMTRYFMTIPEAVQLVIQAGAMAQGGEIFVLDMGEPVKILDLAEDLIRLSGFEPYSEIDIRVTGIRPGEKLFEEILTPEEGTTATKHSQIYVARPNDIDEALLDTALAQFAARNWAENRDQLLDLLRTLVPTYQTPAQVRVG